MPEKAEARMESFKKKTYYALALDPIHIGTGGYRLGRVDNTITREPGTNLPKIPGTGISGVARAYTAMSNPGKYRDEEDYTKSCAGKGGESGDSHCAKNDCPVCTTYGFSSKKKGSFQGLAQFFDARILLFPVHSMLGPVWISCPAVLNEFIDMVKNDDGKTEPVLFKSNLINEDECLETGMETGPTLNLGWLLLTTKRNTQLVKWIGRPCREMDLILNRLVLVPDRLFPRVVNDNLEVRTSVAIDPATGAAESGALYSYEAIPRSTVLWFEVVFNKPEFFRLPDGEIVTGNYQNNDRWMWVKENVETGLDLMQYLGVGGMGTRGMGRLKVLNLDKDKKTEEKTVAMTPEGGNK